MPSTTEISLCEPHLTPIKLVYFNHLMKRINLDIDPCDHITADAIGKPGQRVFYLQAQKADQSYTILIEKIQLQTLAIGIEKFVAELEVHNLSLTESVADYDDDQMRILVVGTPLFRAGDIGIGYDSDRDLMVLVTKEILLDEMDEEDASIVRFWCSRNQAKALALWSMELANRGRQNCPQCGLPMEPDGHFCLKKNGHRH